MSKINPFGYGAPVVKVYTSKDEIVEKITSFSYKHSEDADEECEIVIESDKVTLPDREEFKEGAKLYVVWGYINGIESVKRVVFVRDIKAKFDKKGIKVTLMCYDKFASTKQNSKQKIHKDTNMEDLAKEIAEENGLEFSGVEFLDGSDIHGLREPAYLKPDGDHEMAVDNTSFPVRVDFRKYDVLPQGNKSDNELLQEVADREPGGPYIVEGRDESLRIKKRNLNQKPIKSYTYGGGNFELIEFVPETKNRKRKSANVNVETAGWIRDLKQFIQHNSNANNVEGENYLGDEIDGSPRANPIVEPPVDDIENQDPALDQQPPIVPFALTNIQTMYLNTEEISILEPSGYHTAAIDNTAVIVPYGVIDYNIHDDSVEDGLDDIKAPGDNKKKNASLEKNPATAIVIGDPKIVSGKIITIINVSAKYSGNYYITEAKHMPLYNTGYLLHLKMVKNATGKTKTPAPDALETKDLAGIQNKESGPEVSEESQNTVPYADPSATANVSAVNITD